MVDRSAFEKTLATWLLLSALGASNAAAQAGIEVVASSRRDGISVSNFRQQIGIAEDGTIAFGANTSTGYDRLMIAGPGSPATRASARLVPTTLAPVLEVSPCGSVGP